MTLPNSKPQTPKQKKHTGRLLTNMAQDTGFGYPRAKDAKQNQKGRKRLINLEWNFEVKCSIRDLPGSAGGAVPSGKSQAGGKMLSSSPSQARAQAWGQRIVLQQVMQEGSCARPQDEVSWTYCCRKKAQSRALVRLKPGHYSLHLMMKIFSSLLSFTHSIQSLLTLHHKLKTQAPLDCKPHQNGSSLRVGIFTYFIYQPTQVPTMDTQQALHTYLRSQ